MITATTGVTIFFDSDGRAIYPCRCGQTHTGVYAFEDWNHHNCFHNSPLVDLSEPYLPLRSYLMCMDCGQVFHVEVKA